MPWVKMARSKSVYRKNRYLATHAWRKAVTYAAMRSARPMMGTRPLGEGGSTGLRAGEDGGPAPWRTLRVRLLLAVGRMPMRTGALGRWRAVRSTWRDRRISSEES